MNNLMQIDQQVQQLRIESSIRRERTSRTIEELKSFILQHQDTDHLLIGFKKDTNPYKSKDLKCDLI